MQQKLVQAFFVAFSEFCINGVKGLKKSNVAGRMAVIDVDGFPISAF